MTSFISSRKKSLCSAQRLHTIYKQQLSIMNNVAYNSVCHTAVQITCILLLPEKFSFKSLKINAQHWWRGCEDETKHNIKKEKKKKIRKNDI